MYIPSNLEIIETEKKGKGIVSREFIKQGETICAISLDFFSAGKCASDFSVQIGEDLFVDRIDSILDDFLNHGCNPNARIRLNAHYDYYAIKDIKPGDEITWNYLTTEYDLVKDGLDFDCKCGSDDCLGRIKGFKYLTREQQLELWSDLTPFLRTMIDSDKPIFSSDLFAEKRK